MIDKQIIIDGIDVSGCKRIISNKIYGYVCNCEEDTHLISSCKHRPDCYFKQLAREKQNSQEARDTAIKEFNRAEELKTLLKRKEQECVELKQLLKEIKFWVRELLKRTGQVVPYEIKEILQKINEVEK